MLACCLVGWLLACFIQLVHYIMAVSPLTSVSGFTSTSPSAPQATDCFFIEPSVWGNWTRLSAKSLQRKGAAPLLGFEPLTLGKRVFQ